MRSMRNLRRWLLLLSKIDLGFRFSVSTVVKMADFQAQLRRLFEQHVASPEDTEFEARFGIKGHELLRENIVDVSQRLQGSGWSGNAPVYLLRVTPQFVQGQSGRTALSQVRAEIGGMPNITAFCEDDAISEAGAGNRLRGSVQLVRKTRVKGPDGSTVPPLDNKEFGVRFSLKTEKQLAPRDPLARTTLQNWSASKKLYRLLRRTTYTKPGIAWQVDVSIVRQSRETTFTMQESEVTQVPHTYEVEIEALPSGLPTDERLAQLSGLVKSVLAGIQGTNYPIGRTTAFQVIGAYRELLGTRTGKTQRALQPREFVGLSLMSLELASVQPIDAGYDHSIRKGYCVTDKADGIRRLLFIDPKAQVYTIDTNGRVRFEGCRVHPKYAHSLIDGEHILRDKTGTFINTFAAFDVLIVSGKDMRKLPFTVPNKEDRLGVLTSMIRGLDLTPLSQAGKLTISVKRFYGSGNIFADANAVMQEVAKGSYPYETDGLIFNPRELGMGEGLPSWPVNHKATWPAIFKWKPPSQNTIDFLVDAMRDGEGRIVTGNVSGPGQALGASNSIRTYQVLQLRVGYDKNRHGVTNPCQMVYDGERLRKRREGDSYLPAKFVPRDPYDPLAWQCKLFTDAEGQLLTENGAEVIEDYSIVEFRRDLDAEPGFQWKPIRVRHDKTGELREGQKNYGNAYHVAESVWNSIYHPVTEAMITTGEGIPAPGGDAYYTSRKGRRQFRALRDFHNQVIKRRLILAVARPRGTLIDLAVGKAGDLPKWIDAQLSFVYGIDISGDNIHNPMDGACMRYLEAASGRKRVPECMFVQGSSALDIPTGAAFGAPQAKKINAAILGKIGKKTDITRELGAGVAAAHNKGRGGFDIVSCQFATHYFFENYETLSTFLDNVQALCKPGGYFIGTCYDGQRVFDALRGKEPGDGISLQDQGDVLVSITKEYESDVFAANDTSLGYPILVTQESIGKPAREYLVNMEYLTSQLRMRGFEPAPVAIADQGGLGRQSVDGFSSVFRALERQRGRLRPAEQSALQMGDAEKRLSFLNVYFIYKRMDAGDTA
jgi:hypothetical protein